MDEGYIVVMTMADFLRTHSTNPDIEEILSKYDPLDDSHLNEEIEGDGQLNLEEL